MNSKAFTLNTADLVSLVKNAALVGAAAGLTYFGQNMSGVDLGAISAFVVPVASLTIDALVKWIKDNTKS